MTTSEGSARSVRRRTVLAGGAAGVGATALVGSPTADASDAPVGPRGGVFGHGVASGDPLPHAVVLWTRVTPTRASLPGSGKGPRVTVAWEVATDKRFRHIVRHGTFLTGPHRDHTVKLDVGGLRPATWYHYRFRLGGQTSRVGRTRTAPAAEARVRHLRLGFASCANLPVGYFSAYRGLAERDDLDLVVHLGDYLYESGSSRVRSHEPAHEIVSLADYRQRHGQYKRDADLQNLHAKYPWIITWDDHEVTNDAWKDGAENHTPGDGPGGEGDFHRRRARAHRAYDEWMPVRMSGTASLRDGTRLFRRLRFGTLAEISMLDLRTYRDQQLETPGIDPGVNDAARTITGREQLRWLTDSLDDRRAQWKVIGNPVVLAPIKLAALPAGAADAINAITPLVPQDGAYVNSDQWDGYTADRRTIIDHIATNDVQDTVFITGDIHGAFALDVPHDAGTYPLSDSVAVEFVCTSVTSDNLKDELGTPPRAAPNLAVESAIMAANAHMKYLNFDDHGFCVLDLTEQRAQCDWFVIGDRSDPATPITWTRSFATLRGTSTVVPVDGPVR